MLLLLFLLLNIVSSHKSGILILGSHIDKILSNRINILLDYFSNEINNNEYYIFCSGGKKYDQSSKTEADKMKEILDNEMINFNISYNIIKNDRAKNTVENFKHFIDSSKENLLEELIFVTSKFHRNRAHLIWDNLNERDINNKWILEEISEIEHPWLIEEEKVHIKNVNRDLNKII